MPAKWKTAEGCFIPKEGESKDLCNTMGHEAEKASPDQLGQRNLKKML